MEGALSEQGIPGTPQLCPPGAQHSRSQAFLLVPFALAVLQRLGDVRSVDEVCAAQVGYGAAGIQRSSGCMRFRHNTGRSAVSCGLRRPATKAADDGLIAARLASLSSQRSRKHDERSDNSDNTGDGL